jgi:hypothetical protein
MSIQNEIDRIIVAVEAAHTKVKEKGGTTAAPYLVGNLASAIDTIPNSEDLSAEVKEYAEHLDELETTIETLPDAGSGGAVELCTVKVIVDQSVFDYYEHSEVLVRCVFVTIIDGNPTLNVGEIIAVEESIVPHVLAENVAKNSMLCLDIGFVDPENVCYCVSDDVEIDLALGGGYPTVYPFIVKNTDVTVTIRYD